MAITNIGSVTVRGASQNVSIMYRNPLYVADKLFPIIDGVLKQSKVAKYVKGPWFRDEAEIRAPMGAAVIGEFRLATENLDPINYAFAAGVSEEELAASKEPGALPYKPEADALELIAEKLDLKREVRTSAVLHATNWGGAGAGGADAEGHWGDGTAANDTFLADIVAGRDSILSNTGMLPNTLFLSWPAWSKLQVAPALLALMNPTGLGASALVQIPTLASLIGVNEIIVGMAVKNTDEETVADTSFTSVNIWGTTSSETKGVGFLYYKPATPDLKTASAGYQYRLKKENGAGRISTTWAVPARHGVMYDSEEDVDIAAVGIDLGYMWKDTATT
ncbi:MAG: hypothetical protein KAI70_00705 [Candidatus Omnitrophica bacterium]|nr:hypothetical protein [Candidatus Omnitrophota bacterium]